MKINYFEEWDEEKLLMDCKIDYYNNEALMVKSAITSFIEEFDKEWVQETRDSFLEDSLSEKIKEIDILKNKKKNDFVFLYEKELDKAEMDYKRLYREYNSDDENLNMINDSDIARVKEGTRVEYLLGEPITRTQNKSWYLCPFHNEKTPSFCWNENDHYFKCFGCQAKGDIITLHMHINKCSFIESVKSLR